MYKKLTDASSLRLALQEGFDNLHWYIYCFSAFVIGSYTSRVQVFGTRSYSSETKGKWKRWKMVKFDTFHKLWVVLKILCDERTCARKKSKMCRNPVFLFPLFQIQGHKKWVKVNSVCNDKICIIFMQVHYICLLTAFSKLDFMASLNTSVKMLKIQDNRLPPKSASKSPTFAWQSSSVMESKPSETAAKKK